MKPLVCASFFCLLVLGISMQKIDSPKVQVYSRNPGEFGKLNVIICHVSGFYPPQIQIDILRNDVAMAKTLQTDLAFDEEWQYYLTKHADFTPSAKDKYACRNLICKFCSLPCFRHLKSQDWDILNGDTDSS